MFGFFPTYGSSLLSDHPCLGKESYLKEKTWANETIFYWKHKTRGKTMSFTKRLRDATGLSLFNVFWDFVLFWAVLDLVEFWANPESELRIK